MKPLILIVLLGASAQAQIYYKNISVCNSWNYSNGGYVCSSYPSSESLVDQYSLNSKIQNLEARLQNLERKLTQVEFSCVKPF